MRDYHLPGRSPVYATHGMAATSMPAATLTALDVLRAGGNALDAAVAACAVLCVIEPQSTGIGGDCFCLYAPAGAGKVVALNGSGRAPGRRDHRLVREGRASRAIENTSAHAVTVPGALSAWETLLKAHGRKGLDELLQPAIRYAEDGWPVHPKVAWDWKRLEGKLRKNGARAFPARRQGAAAGRPASRSRRWPRRCARSPGTAPRRSTKARSPPTWWPPCASAAACTPRRISPPACTVADFVEPITPELARLRRLAVPAERPGHRGADDPGHAGRLGLGAGRPAGRRSALHRHIEAARLAYRDRDAFVADPSPGRRAGAQAAEPGVSRRRCAR